MPTDTLSVSTEITINQISDGPNNCSLIFLWKSNAEGISAPDKWLLKRPRLIHLLPIYVDFLPALESLPPSSSGAGDEHDYVLVPKECNVRWRWNHD